MADTGNHNSILIVDDDKKTIELLHSALKDQGYNVVVARDGKEALQYMQERSFEIIITDLDMPEVDGYQLIDTMSTTQRDHKVLVISDEKEKRERLLKRGILEAFGQPVRLEDFLAEIMELLRQRRRTKRFELKEEHNRQIRCTLRDSFTRKAYEGWLLNISFDGALIETDEMVDDRVKRISLELALTEKSSMICRVAGGIVRITPSAVGSVVALFFDNDRDLQLLEHMAPYLHLDTAQFDPEADKA